jgi:hypothetical protein
MTKGNTDLIKSFTKIQQYLEKNINKYVEFYLTVESDPVTKYFILEGFYKIIKQILQLKFKTFPPDLLPRCRCKILDDEMRIEVMTQNFFTENYKYIYLGTGELKRKIFDFYFRPSFDPSADGVFYARYDHNKDSFIAGSNKAEAEYNLGMPTPLAIAYGIAKNDGFIKEGSYIY